MFYPVAVAYGNIIEADYLFGVMVLDQFKIPEFTIDHALVGKNICYLKIHSLITGFDNEINLFVKPGAHENIGACRKLVKEYHIFKILRKTAIHADHGIIPESQIIQVIFSDPGEQLFGLNMIT